MTTTTTPTRPTAALAAEPWQAALAFTRMYQQSADLSPAQREVACLRFQYPASLQPIKAGDLLAGRIQYALVGFSPEPGGLGYYCRFDIIRQTIDQCPPELRGQIDSAVKFWTTECTAAKVRAAYPAELARVVPSDNWTSEPGIAFPLYRLAGGMLDFGKLVRLGLPGLAGEVRAAASRAADAEARDLYEGMLAGIDIVRDCCLAYAGHAEAMAGSEGFQADDCQNMAQSLRAIAHRAPRSLHEAAQLAWLYCLVSGSMNMARMDVYLGDFLVADLEAGRLDEAGALRILQSLWQLIADRKTIYNGRVIIGGRGRPNQASADRVALLAIEATRTVKEVEPQLTLRFHGGQNPLLMERALDSLGEGRTYPMLYNDDINVPAVAKAFGVTMDEAEHYLPFGCGEYVLDHRSFGTPSGVINLLKALEVTLFGGKDPTTGRSMGLPGPTLAQMKTFDELMAAYQRQVQWHVEALADQEMLEYRVAGRISPFVLTSLLFDDCIARGRAMFRGGVRYLGGTIETYGNTNTADSLTAIRQLVFETGRITPADLLAALDGDFAGAELIRQQLLSAPKYGNDDERADATMRMLHDHVCTVSKAQAARVGLSSYLVVVINNWANTILGEWTAASADGRRAGQPMANGNAPSPGSDRNGVTACLKSIAKPDPAIHAGAVQNLKFSRDLFVRQRPKLRGLLDGYFAQGGTQATITVVSRDDLQQALADPEKWAHLMVRVGGFSARFVELPRKAQEEILGRTLY